MEIKLPGILQAEFLAQSPRLTTPHLLSPLGLQDHFLPFPLLEFKLHGAREGFALSCFNVLALVHFDPMCLGQ